MKYFLMAFIAIITFSCNRGKNEQALMELNRNVENIKDQKGLTDSTATTNNASTQILNAGAADWDRKIIKTANVNMELKEYAGFNTTVHQSLKSYGAYIGQEQQLQSETEISNTISIKVPVDQFEALLNYLTLADKDAKVLERQITTDDVSTQIVDTKSRVESKKQLREKYFELLKQSKKMEDMLHVQGEINAITSDIESAASRVEYLSHQSAYSTINLKYFQALNATKTDGASLGFLRSLSQAFNKGGAFIIGILLFLVNIWPLVIGGGIAWYYFRKKVSKVKSQQVS